MFVLLSPRSILVGAPNEVGPNGTRRTGAVYRCQLDKSDSNCNRLVPFDSYTGMPTSIAEVASKYSNAFNGRYCG